MPMLKIAIIIWVMLGTVLAGTAVMTVLSVPGLAENPMKVIPLAALLGFLLAMPLSYIVANKIGRGGHGSRA